MPDIEIKYNNTTIASLDGYYVGSAPQEAIKTCTGGVALASGYKSALIFSITGNGTATIDGVDWKYNY